MRTSALRVSLFVLLAASGVAGAQQTSLSAQQPPAGSEWDRVRALPAGTSVHIVHIQGRTRTSLCAVTAVDADSISCSRDTGVGHAALSFPRAEVRSIQLARRGRSAVLGAAIGGGAGALAGGIQGAGSNYFAVKGAFALIYGLSGALVGAPMGYLTDVSKATIYRAP